MLAASSQLHHARLAVLLGAGAALALVLGALGFQHLGGMAPCQMCYWQRWPHYAAAALGGLALLLAGDRRPVLLAAAVIIALCLLTSAGIGVYHVGVEQKLWAGPGGCTAADVTGSFDDIMKQIIATPVVRCDEIPWSLFGISMAGYNVLISALAAGATLWLAKRASRT